MSDLSPASQRLTPRKAAYLVGLALVGAVTGAWFADVMETYVHGSPDDLAAMVGLICIISGIASAGAVLLRKGQVSNDCAWLQVASCVVAGVMLLLPILAPEAWPAELVYGGVALLILSQFIVNLRFWQVSDELMRRVVVETAALSFGVLQLALFAWAAAERLGLVPTVSAWGLIGVLLAAYLLASLVIAVRRGIAHS